MKVIPEVNFNEEFSGDLHFDLEVDLRGFLKVNFIFLNGNPLFLHLQSIDRIPEVNFEEIFIGELCIDLGDDLQGFFKVNNDVNVVNSVPFGVLD